MSKAHKDLTREELIAKAVLENRSVRAAQGLGGYSPEALYNDLSINSLKGLVAAADKRVASAEATYTQEAQEALGSNSTRLSALRFELALAIDALSWAKEKAELAKTAAGKSKERERLRELISRKEDEKLENASLEDLQKMLNDLEG